MPPHVLIDFVVPPPGCDRTATDFWGWGAHRAQLRCPDDVSDYMYEREVPGGALKLNSAGYPDHGRYADPLLQGKITTAVPGIEPGISWLVVRSFDHPDTRLVFCGNVQGKVRVCCNVHAGTYTAPVVCKFVSPFTWRPLKYGKAVHYCSASAYNNYIPVSCQTQWKCVFPVMSDQAHFDSLWWSSSRIGDTVAPMFLTAHPLSFSRFIRISYCMESYSYLSPQSASVVEFRLCFLPVSLNTG
jgi:hypothetical protein